MTESSKIGSVQDDNGPISMSRIKDKAVEGLGGALRDMIPSDDIKAYHPKYFFPLAAAICFGMLTVFIGLFIPTFLNEMNNEYLSPADADEPAKCDAVPVSHTGIYYATQGGYWAGSDKYCYSNTTYSFALSNSLYSTDSYEQDMRLIYHYLQHYGAYSSRFGLGVVLTFWMSFTILPNNITTQRFTLFADPRNVFDREKVMGSVGSSSGFCLPNSSTTNFHTTNGRISLAMDVSEIYEDPACNAAIKPYLFGYQPITDLGNVFLSLDIRALVTSYALNTNVMEMNEVEEVIGSYIPIGESSTGKMIGIGSYYDPSYPGMQSITCLSNYSPQVCIVTIGSVIALPIFQHVGNSTEWPILCDCRNPDLGDLSDEKHPCHQFNFMASLLYYNTDKFNGILELTSRYTMKEIVQKSYLAMFLSSIYGASSSRSDELYSNETLIHEAFDWCHSETYGNCSFLVYSAWDEIYYDFTVNPYYYQLRRGACRNTITTTPENWQRLTLYNSVINSVGVASGNLSLLTPFVVIFFLLIAGVYQRCTGNRWPQGYHPEQKQEILDDLATILLLVRDNRLGTATADTTSEVVQKLHLTKISKELTALSRQLVKQYEEGPKEDDKVEDSVSGCLSVCKRRKREKSADQEEDGVGDSDAIETHYGHYNVLPRGILVETGEEDTVI
eukprot:scaffold6829_cov162-Ochromonas_danica.AAC.5